MDTYEAGSAWYQRVESDIANLKLTLDKKQRAAFQLDLLLRIARRLDEFSLTCQDCGDYKQQVTGLLQEAPNLAQFPSKESTKLYRKAVNDIAAHLKKQHKLVDQGTYMGVGIGIGSGLGTALAASLQNPGYTGIGVALGVAIGAALDARAKKTGKVI